MTTGLILAGGKSQRMGQDKSLMILAGRSLIERALDALKPVCDELLIATNAPHLYEHLHVRTVPDRIRGGGSLAGLHAGLADAGETVIAVACDMPFLNTELLGYLVSLCGDVDAVVPDLSGPTQSARARAGGGGRPRAKNLDLHPLHAVYRRTCLPAIEAHSDKAGGTVGQQKTVILVERGEHLFDPAAVEPGQFLFHRRGDEVLQRLRHADRGPQATGIGITATMRLAARVGVGSITSF